MPDLTTAARELLEALDAWRALTAMQKREASIEDLWNAEEALRSALEASGWQPISTAPKDGTEILLSSPKGAAIANGAWIGVGWAWPYLRREPAYWQPLPAPPEAKP